MEAYDPAIGAPMEDVTVGNGPSASSYVAGGSDAKRQRVDDPAAAPPQAVSADAPRFLGTVTKFASNRGYGVISPDDGGPTLFAHWSQIVSTDEWPSLEVDQRVEYSINHGTSKLAAAQITLPGGGLIVMPQGTQRKRAGSNRVLTDFYVTGAVDWFGPAAYGFIKLDHNIEWQVNLSAGQTVYVSKDDLIMAEGYPSAVSGGQRVRFRLYKPDNKPPAAAEVTDEDGNPLVFTGTEAPRGPAGKGGKAGKGGTPPLLLSSGKGGPILARGPIGGGPIGAGAAAAAVRAPGRAPAAAPGRVSKWGPPTSQEVSEEDEYQQILATLSAADAGVDPNAPKEELSSQALDALSLHYLASQNHEEEAQAVPAAASPSPQGGLVQHRYIVPTAGSAALGLRPGSVIPMEVGAEAAAQDPASPGPRRVPPMPSPTPAATALPTSIPASAVPCKFYQEGRCSKGAECRFSHEGPASAAAVPARRTVVCRFFMEGRCIRGSACPFSHGASATATNDLAGSDGGYTAEELAAMSGGASTVASPVFRTTAAAAAAALTSGGPSGFDVMPRGLADTSTGRSGGFSDGPPAPRGFSDGPPPTNGGAATKGEPCPFYQRGECKQGSSCIYAHIPSSVLQR